MSHVYATWLANSLGAVLVISAVALAWLHWPHENSALGFGVSGGLRST